MTYAMERQSRRGRVTWAAGAGALCAVALFAAAPPAARAGVELTTEISSPGEPSQAPRTGRMLLDADRVRMELGSSDAAGDPAALMIYRGDRDVAWRIDVKRKTYTEVDRDRMEAIRGQSEAARAKMRAEFDKLPPAEQARMQAMLAANEAMTAPRDLPAVKETGRRDKVGGLPCHEVELSRGATKQSEICVADWSAAGVTKADLAPLRKLAAFQQKMLGGMSARRDSDDVLELFDALDGLPVRVRSFRGDQPRSEFRIVKIEHKAIDGKLFEPPAGFQKRTFSITVPGMHGPGTPPGAAMAPGGAPAGAMPPGGARPPAGEAPAD